MGNSDEILGVSVLANPAFAEENLTKNEKVDAKASEANDLESNGEIENFPSSEIRRASCGDDVFDEREDGEGSGNIVDFDGPDDPLNPINWSRTYKWTLVVLISFMSCVVYVSSPILKLLPSARYQAYSSPPHSNLAILMCAPATPSILSEFHSESKLASTILVSIWECGEMIGPLLVGPLSEIYGRLPVYNAANISFVIFSAVAAESRSISMLITLRFFLGASVASTTLNPCIVGDMFKQEERGSALAVMGMTPFIAPILGPIVGGFISQAKGWRWTFWVVTIICGAFEIGFLLLYRESYKVRILERKAVRLRKETGNVALRSRYQRDVSARRVLGEAMVRPAKLLL